MLIAIGRARALSGRRADLVSAARDVVAASRKDEGCQSYGFFADLADEDTIVSVEIWRDQTALDAHMAHEHTQDFLARASGLIDGTPDMAVHEVLAPD